MITRRKLARWGLSALQTASWRRYARMLGIGVPLSGFCDAPLGVPSLLSFAGADHAAKLRTAIASGESFYIPAGLGAINVDSVATGVLSAGQSIYGAGAYCGTWLQATNPLTHVLRLGSGSRIIDLEIRGGGTFTGTTKNNDGAIYCVRIQNVSTCEVSRCKFSGYLTAGVYIASNYDVGELTKDIVVADNLCIGVEFDSPGSGSSVFGIFAETQ